MAAARDGASPEGADGDRWIDDARRDHLLRAARARLWLQTVFEPRHSTKDIPNDAPELAQARSDRRRVRETTVHELCSLILVPDDGTAADHPAWRQRAESALTGLRRHIDPLILAGDPDACTILRELSQYTRDTPDAKVRFEAAGFDLHACAEEDADGSCVRRRWAEEWVEQVERAGQPGFLPPFFSRFGLHYVYVHAILPPRPASDPTTEAALRTEVLTEWRHRQLAEHLAGLKTQDTVRLRMDQPSPAP